LKEKLTAVETRKIEMEKRLNKELKQYKNEIAELKSRLSEQIYKVATEC